MQLTVITGLAEGRDDVSGPESIVQDVTERFGERAVDAFRDILTFDLPQQAAE